MKPFKNILSASALALILAALSFTTSKKGEFQRNSIVPDTIIIKNKKENKINKVDLPVFATEATLDTLLKENRAIIVHYGLVPVYNPEFEKKYGVRIHNEGCIIGSGKNNPAKINNDLVAAYLDKRCGNDWKKELGFTPFGI